MTLVALWALAVPAHGQIEESAGPGVIRSEAILDNRAVAVSVPTLPMDGEAYSALASGADHRPIRVARLEADAAFELGSVGIPIDELSTEEDASTGQESEEFDLWLTAGADETTTSAWSLVVSEVQDSEAVAPSEVVGTLAVTHHTVTAPSARLTGGFVAEGSDTGRLHLRWGDHVWTSRIRFTMPRERPPRRRLSGVGSSRAFDFDSSPLQVQSRLATRDIVRVTLPDGSQLGTVYPKKLTVDEPDFAHLVSVATDAVVTLTAGAVIRLDSDVPLAFDDVTLDTGNVGLRGSPGSYGVWLKRALDGWRLVFNNEPDAWGTQHDPAFDVAEVPVRYRQVDHTGRALSASVVMTSSDGGEFVLVWGPHEWAAEFEVAR